MQANRVLDDGELEPECERLVRNLRELGEARVGEAEAWDLGLTAAERAAAEKALAVAGGRPVLAVSVGTKVQSKDWGLERWRALLLELGGEYPGYGLGSDGGGGGECGE